ncbi:hypothetical protein PAF38_004558 [Salmonella enterica]|uniref:Uncharacterized protein n=1 Tax=Salmonella dublin TaxID=98360 RepID=A0A732GK47_SALDU|nr:MULTISPECIES: hypothetical protein [Enterobacteriaceae]EAP8967479.1 hypothetical protein [Salmonella enterica]ECM4824461.1 hypothetical protein [Salmonella enterica subsp. enterica serovar Infantis]EDC6631029.1 hypothetical protein [Salmonella enterica subsp. enterica serovar Enteritidis]EDN0389111.1 hypothetical protein [Salmonella enterica subsp. enterica serovar Newport]EKR1396004.1 hypothetical protein [Salmonella enterica subsp. enterica serovar Dublin]
MKKDIIFFILILIVFAIDKTMNITMNIDVYIREVVKDSIFLKFTITYLMLLYICWFINAWRTQKSKILEKSFYIFITMEIIRFVLFLAK